MLSNLKSLFIASTLIVSTSCATSVAAATPSVDSVHPPLIDIVRQSKRCGDGARWLTTDCTYKVGRDLEMTIHGVGQEYAVLVVNKSKYEGDFHAEFGLMWNNCVMIRPGPRNRSYETDDSSNWVFISLKNAEPYSDFESCHEAK